MKKAFTLITAGIASATLLAQTSPNPNRLLVRDKLGNVKGYLIERIDSIFFAQGEDNVSAEISYKGFASGEKDTVILEVKPSTGCDAFKLACVKSTTAESLGLDKKDEGITIADYVNNSGGDFIRGGSSEVRIAVPARISPNTEYTIFSVGYDEYGIACGTDTCKFSISESTPGSSVPGSVPDVVNTALFDLYPNAQDVNWSRDSTNVYWVAVFSLPATRRASGPNRNSAWFDEKGKWYMTENDIMFLQSLPQAVQDAFRNSGYANWRIDDIDIIRRQGAETVYVIEVEGRQQQDGREVEVEIDLYYSEDGVLVKKLVDVEDDYDYHDFIPSQPATSITEFIKEHYPNARIVEIDRENGMTEVEIIDGRTCREVLFDASDKWIHTKTEVAYAAVPEQVRQAFEDSEYKTYRVDDVDYYETPTGNYYRFELKSINGEMKVEIDESGKILSGYNPGDPGSNGGGNNGNNGSNGGMGTGGDIEKFIQGKYPNARIVEYDYDDGLIEVEIIHDGHEKSVYFNGAKEWVMTRWDLRREEVPSNVMTTINSEIARLGGSRYHLEEVERVEMPQPDVNYYFVELEDRGDNEIWLRIGDDGSIL